MLPNFRFHQVVLCFLCNADLPYLFPTHCHAGAISHSTSTTFRHAPPTASPAANYQEQKDSGRTSDHVKGELYPEKPEGYTGTEGEDAPPYDPQNPDRHIYSRYTQPVMTRAEKVLSVAVVSIIRDPGWFWLGAQLSS